MKFSFLTLFPELITPYFKESILKNAIDKNLISIEAINLRDFAFDKYKKVDDAAISGGAGQVLRADVLGVAIEHIKEKNSRVIFLSPCGKSFSNTDAKRLAISQNHLILVCGRYEGFDERAIEGFCDEIFSVGDFILTGGELPALCVCDSIARQIPSVLGNPSSLLGESFEDNLLEAPNFARDMIFQNSKFNKKYAKFYKIFQKYQPILDYSKGNHTKIAGLKQKLSALKTQYFRP